MCLSGNRGARRTRKIRKEMQRKFKNPTFAHTGRTSGTPPLRIFREIDYESARKKFRNYQTPIRGRTGSACPSVRIRGFNSRIF
jgi:hypothetical protein